jgi:single-strand DNA-binding protein
VSLASLAPAPNRAARGRAGRRPGFQQTASERTTSGAAPGDPFGIKKDETMSAAYLNRVQLIGCLGRDPEVRTTQSGGRIVTLNIATSESWKDKNSGERRERTEWHRAVIFNDPLGRLVEQYLAKGSKVYLEGKLTTRKWQDQSGADRYSTEIHLTPYNGVLKFLDARREAEGNGSTQPRSAPARDVPNAPDLDDEVPF